VGRRRNTVGAELRGGARPELAVRPLQGPVWVAIWCKRMRETRVIHWDLVRGPGMAGAWGSAVEAALRRRLTGVGRSRRARAKFEALNERKARLEHGEAHQKLETADS